MLVKWDYTVDHQYDESNVGEVNGGRGNDELNLKHIKFDLSIRPSIAISSRYLDIQTWSSTERSELELHILESLVYSWHLGHETR